jgi:cathepsin L
MILIPSQDEFSLQNAIAFVGPISVSLQAINPSFKFYSHGIYYEPICNNTLDSLDHCIL